MWPDVLFIEFSIHALTLNTDDNSSTNTEGGGMIFQSDPSVPLAYGHRSWQVFLLQMKTSDRCFHVYDQPLRKIF